MEPVKKCPLNPVKDALINLRGLVEQFGDSNDANALNILEHEYSTLASQPEAGKGEKCPNCHGEMLYTCKKCGFLPPAPLATKEREITCTKCKNERATVHLCRNCFVNALEAAQ